MAYEISRRGLLKLGSLATLALGSSLLVKGYTQDPGYSRPSQGEQPKKYPQNADDPKTQEIRYIKLLENILSRGGLIGEVLTAKLGLEEKAILDLPKDPSKEEFRKWLEKASKRTVTLSRLRVPNLRSDRPCLDGQDIYEGFFAPVPGTFDFSAPLEGSLSRLKRQGYDFSDQERDYLDEMLKTCLKETKNGIPTWYSLPVGSRISITSGERPEFEIWINKGPQLPSVDETITKAEYDKRPIIRISDKGQIRVLNKHYDLALTCEDDETKKKTDGRFTRIIDRLYDVLTTKRFDPKQFL